MPPSPSHLLVADPVYPRLKEHLIGVTGLAYYADKDGDLAGRIALRLGRLNLPGCAAYLALLESGKQGEEELDALIEDLTIGETFFFRHREMFNALRDVVVPEISARNRHSRQLRIWSAGCSTGAELYSVSILLRRDLAALLPGWDITIIGTDINREFLARAREGRFEEWAFRGTPDSLRRDCFLRTGNSWFITPPFKEGVSFQYHNLVVHPFPSLLNNLFAFDVILCRNVTIYFSPEIVQRIIGHFHQSLANNGWLLVGHAEPNTQLFQAFRTVNAEGAILYQKTPASAGLAADVGNVPAPSCFPEQGPFLPVPPVAPDPANWFVPLGGTAAFVGWSPPTFPNAGESIPPGSPEKLPPPATPIPMPAEAVSEVTMIRALADRGEWDEAALRCGQLLERDKLNPVVHFYQALTAEQTGRHAETEQALRRAIYLDRGFALAHYYLGLHLQKQGQLPQAARSFQNVLQLLSRLDPGHVFADGDGITAAELAKLTQMHVRVLEEA